MIKNNWKIKNPKFLLFKNSNEKCMKLVNKLKKSGYKSLTNSWGQKPRLYLLGFHILLGTLIGEPVLQTTTKYNASLSIMASKLSYENKAFTKTIINDHWNVSIINMTKQIFVWFYPCHIWWIWWWLTFFLSFLHRWNSWASTK